MAVIVHFNGKACYFCFGVDFPQERTVTAMPSCAPSTTTRERELFTLWTRLQIHRRPAAPAGQQLSRLTVSFLSAKPLSVAALRTVMILTHRWTSLALSRLDHNSTSKVASEDRKKGTSSFLSLFSLFCLIYSGGEQVTRAMSRKKAVKGKGSSKSPKASPSSGRDSGRTGKGLAAAAAPSSGLVYPSRPSISNSGEFYDIAFKVSRSSETQLSNQSVCTGVHFCRRS